MMSNMAGHSINYLELNLFKMYVIQITVINQHDNNKLGNRSFLRHASIFFNPWESRPFFPININSKKNKFPCLVNSNLLFFYSPPNYFSPGSQEKDLLLNHNLTYPKVTIYIQNILIITLLILLSCKSGIQNIFSIIYIFLRLTTV